MTQFFPFDIFMALYIRKIKIKFINLMIENIPSIYFGRLDT